MANPYAGLINNAFKTQFKNAIDALIEGCEQPCKLVFPGASFIDCSNCRDSNQGKFGPNPFIHDGGGTHTGLCPACNGSKKIRVEKTESVDLVVIWNGRRFKDLASAVKAADGEVTTFCATSLLSKIRNCAYAIFNTNVQDLGRYEFVRDGEPVLHGLGEDAYIVTEWKKK